MLWPWRSGWIELSLRVPRLQRLPYRQEYQKPENHDHQQPHIACASWPGARHLQRRQHCVAMIRRIVVNLYRTSFAMRLDIALHRRNFVCRGSPAGSQSRLDLFTLRQVMNPTRNVPGHSAPPQRGRVDVAIIHRRARRRPTLLHVLFPCLRNRHDQNQHAG